MTQVLTVPTHFNDIGELSDGFLDRVEQDTLILYGPVAYEEGSTIEFAVLLADGTAALEGTGRIRAAVDGGDERVPETRYDVVVEALELDARSEVVFERLIMSRQAVSDHPAPEDEAPVTGEMETAVAESEEEALEMSVESLGPEAYEDDDDEGDEPPTVMAEVDAHAIMAEAAESEADSQEIAEEDVAELDADSDWASAAETTPPEASDADDALAAEDGVEADDALVAEFESAVEHENEIATVIANANATEIAFESADDEETEGVSEPSPHYDSMYAFEHGIAAEPKVGMPVPVPSMAAPPAAPPAPPTLRLAEPPDGLTRPSLAQPEDSLFSVDGEVSDVHTTGLFAYEDGLPIPSRPPLPDPNRAKQVPAVEAANDYDVEESEPPELLAEDYEEVRLSDFAEAVEEG